MRVLAHVDCGLYILYEVHTGSARCPLHVHTVSALCLHGDSTISARYCFQYTWIDQMIFYVTNILLFIILFTCL